MDILNNELNPTFICHELVQNVFQQDNDLKHTLLLTKVPVPRKSGGNQCERQKFADLL